MDPRTSLYYDFCSGKTVACGASFHLTALIPGEFSRNCHICCPHPDPGVEKVGGGTLNFCHRASFASVPAEALSFPKGF